MEREQKALVIIGMLGSTLDAGFHEPRWEKWRPTLSLCRHADLPVARYELLFDPKFKDTAGVILADIERVSPFTETRSHANTLNDPWDFQEVYGALHSFAKTYPFNTDKEDYLVHITTGTHVQQICLFLLTESRHLPARLIQSAPKDNHRRGPEGKYAIIDLDLSKYDGLASRFEAEVKEARTFLKSGIETRNARFNALIEQLEHVAVASKDPILLMGPTGAGKSQLARRIYELKKARHQLSGAFVEVNCATLRGDSAMSTLFGHVKGSFTGAMKDRPGLLRAADGGLLFLDEIGELGADEQAMLLRALEEKRFLPLGGDDEASSNFELIAGTNRHLSGDVVSGRFREDLLARINLWTFRLPGLRERPEDIEPNLGYELDQYARRSGRRVTINKEARERFLAFAESPEAKWNANFRDLNAAVTRMATLAPSGRINTETTEEEMNRLKEAWATPPSTDSDQAILKSVVSPDRLAAIDLFDQLQLASVIRVCRESQTQAEAGRKLFGVTRLERSTINDSDRVRKFLARFELTFGECRNDG